MEENRETRENITNKRKKPKEEKRVKREKKPRKELNVQIGYRVKERRELAKLTQEKLAEAVDVSTQYISDLERGEVGASVATIIKICNVLHSSSDYILMGQESPSSFSPVLRQVPYLSPEQQNLVDKSISVLLEAYAYNK